MAHQRRARTDLNALSRRTVLVGGAAAASIVALGAAPALAGSGMAWGGYSNGKIPLGALRALSWASSQYLHPGAAADFERLNASYKARFGRNIAVTDAYRDYAAQVSVKARKGKFAATPGTSNHGWGKAVDLGDTINSFTSEKHLWLRANCDQYGWTHPTWAHDGNPNNGQQEPWHFEYIGDGGGISPAPDPDPDPALPDVVPEDDMATLIWNGTYGFGLLDGGHLALIGDQSTVDAWSGAGVKRVTVSNGDFMRMLRASNNTFIIYNSTRGYGVWSGGRGVGLGSQAAVNQFADSGCPQINVDVADFDRFMS
ncbi:D-alanyl-D-alanine carboxypeptidase family protein [Cellulomonas algicola]|uniref:D-alanyl-D-alanine carboxypeptidase-like core domain-containing protein n=1 Tax=Cellulomonas algicola TaxID=2071633 RepID=A0A401UZI6_9CELL|nr:M15 family metallopeptidase [Cellulomonas algicola]GCD20024.1 hypothetical protein CTKZ_15860 [Cellulomonas algicola]